MSLDYATVERLRKSHPAWRLLRSDHAPLVTTFLQRVFVTPNVRTMSEANLAEALEDDLFELRAQLGEQAFPKSARDYLSDWASDDKGWLRKFYPQHSDEAHFDLTPATEQAITWLAGLTERSFIGTESRLLTLFELLRQIHAGSNTDAEARIAELETRRQHLEAEIERIRAGDLPLLDDTALKDRFQQFVQIARELLSDFRQVEHNFRGLDRHVRERIALWQGGKGELLETILGERDAIADSDQGRSFRAFWDFIMSRQRQEELSERLQWVLQLAPLKTLNADPRLARVHYDWLEAGEHTQRTVARLSQQLRRFLDDQAWLENRRIMDLLHGIEANALAVRDAAPKGEFLDLADTRAHIALPMERPMFSPPRKSLIADVALDTGDADLDTAALFAQVVVDKARLAARIRKSLRSRTQVRLSDLLAEYPLEQGLAELLAYLQLASESPRAMVDEDACDIVEWRTDEALLRRARLPRIIFVGG